MGRSLVAQLVKDLALALSLHWLGFVFWRRYDPWPRNFHMGVGLKKKNDMGVCFSGVLGSGCLDPLFPYDNKLLLHSRKTVFPVAWQNIIPKYAFNYVCLYVIKSMFI